LSPSLDGEDGSGHSALVTCELQVLDRPIGDGERFHIGSDKLLECVLTVSLASNSSDSFWLNCAKLTVYLYPSRSQGPQLRHAFSELDISEAEQVSLHASVNETADPTVRNQLTMSTMSDQCTTG
jgi:hypothetical protein